jgi:hypothetical protein
VIYTYLASCRLAGIIVRIGTKAAFGADAALLTEQEGAAEQVGPDFHAVEAPLVLFGTDRAGAEWRCLGINSRKVYHVRQGCTSEKGGCGFGWGAGSDTRGRANLREIRRSVQKAKPF